MYSSLTVRHAEEDLPTYCPFHVLAQIFVLMSYLVTIFFSIYITTLQVAFSSKQALKSSNFASFCFPLSCFYNKKSPKNERFQKGPFHLLRKKPW